MERYWLCSNKFAIFVPSEIPLWTEFQENRFSLQAQIQDSPFISFHVSFLNGNNHLGKLISSSIFIKN